MDTLIDTLNSLQTQFPAIIKLISAVAYLLGLSLVVKGIYTLKIYGEARTRESPTTSLKPSLIYFLVGVALVFTPTTIDIAMQTMYGNSNILAYPGSDSSFNGFQFATVFLYFVQVIGFISFIRGWVMISKLVHGATQERSYGIALTHIIGGILAMNIHSTIIILAATFGTG